MKILLYIKYSPHISIEITSYDKNRISTCVYAGDGGWVSQYYDKTFEEVCALERSKIQEKIKTNSCTKSALIKLLNFNQTKLF